MSAGPPAEVDDTVNGMSLDTTLADGVLSLTLNRPDKYNAIDPELRVMLVDAFDTAGERGARAIIVRGHGRGFCAGADSTALDATDQKAVNAFVDSVVAQAGRIDISCNVIGVGDVQKPLLELSVADFLQPIEIAMRTQFVTSSAAGSGAAVVVGSSDEVVSPLASPPPSSSLEHPAATSANTASADTNRDSFRRVVMAPPSHDT